MIGSWTRGEIMGHLASGELFASYNLGDEFTSGHQVELVQTTSEIIPTYSVSSNEIKIYTDGKAELSSGLSKVIFNKEFSQLLGEDPNVTITPIGESEGIHLVEISKTGFTVKENKNGTSSIRFTWIAVGNRIDNYTKAKVPSDILEKDFDENMKGVMFNESDTKHSAKPIWWDGEKIRFDELPAKSISTKNIDQEKIFEIKSDSKTKVIEKNLKSKSQELKFVGQ